MWWRAIIYPGVTLGAVALGWVLVAHAVPAPVALALVAASALGVVLGLERLVPFEPRWRRDHGGDARVDWLHLLVSARFLDLGVALAWGLGLGVRELRGTAVWWPSAWPLAAQVVALLLLGELPGYLYHRLQHQHAWFWRIHRVHHSAPRVYSVNTARNHPLDVLTSGLLSALPLALLGPPEPVLLVAGCFSTAHAFLQHANVDLRLGPLRYLISGPEAHRWHHSAVLAEANANYGQVLLVYDLLLGTLRIPPRRQPDAIGLAGGDHLDESYLAQLASPWRAPATARGTDNVRADSGAAPPAP